MHRPARSLPGVVGRARAERWLIGGYAWVAAHFHGALRVPEEVRVVAFLPDEHEVRSGHELGDERAPGGRTRERISADAPPAAVVTSVVLAPELLLLVEVLERDADRLECRSLLHASTIRPVEDRRDVALVLSGGGMNAMLLETGLLQRLRAEAGLWQRVGWIYGTSAGALAGTMAATDRLDQLEEFLMGLRPEEVFRPHALWQLPLTGLHDYTLPETIAARVAPMEVLATELATAPIELVVCVTELSPVHVDGDESAFERTYSSRSAPPDEMGSAVLASAAISALVLPLRVGETIGTDGGWVRNFPLGHAYDNPDVGEILAFRHVSRHPRPSGENLSRFRRRLEPFRAVPPVRALMTELQASEDRRDRGEPAHLPEMLARLMRVAIARNTALEERQATAKDVSVQELGALRDDVVELARRHAAPWRRRQAADAVTKRFAAARFPFRHDRRLPITIVHGDAGEHALDPTFRAGLVWPDDAKRALLARGRELAEQALSERAAQAAP